ncbi:hypothetical protein Tco_1547950 [Tanacetum coccineum]
MVSSHPVFPPLTGCDTAHVSKHARTILEGIASFPIRGLRFLTASCTLNAFAIHRSLCSLTASRVLDAPDCVLGIFLQHINVTLGEIPRKYEFLTLRSSPNAIGQYYNTNEHI